MLRLFVWSVEVKLKKQIATVLAILVLSSSADLLAQEPLNGTENPLAVLHEEVGRVLGEANLPFSEEQSQAIILMMEERRKASEDLFGDLNNFQAGPTRGQESDRLQSAI